MNIEALVQKYANLFYEDNNECVTTLLGAVLTEQAEAFKGELQAHDGMVRELTKTVEDMQAAQSVPVVDGLSVWLRKDQIQHVNQFGPALRHTYANEQTGTLAFIEKPTHSITAADLRHPVRCTTDPGNADRGLAGRD